MSDQYEAQVSDSGKNQNEQSSADRIESAEEPIDTRTPVLVAEDDGEPKPFDIDGGSLSLEDLIKRAIKGTKKKTDVPVPPLTPVETTNGTAPAEAHSAGVDAELVVALKAQIEQEKNNTLRALADLQNLRRRSDDERIRIIREGNERLIKEILPVLDDFERGLSAAKDVQSYELLINGVESVLRKFADILTKQGVEPIPSVGEPFNPDLHEAVSVMEAADDVPDESVVQELRKGYTLHGRVIRPSLVTVAKS